MEMAGWLLWLLIACGFGAGEILSGSGFYLAPFAVGAVLAAGADSAIDGAAGVIVFLVMSVLTLTALRPLVVRRLQSGPGLRTGAAALVGKRGVVLERIANHEGAGRVRIDHEVWTARALDEDCVIEVGTQVEIVDIKGATALVME
jgi:membrane protein implicated in regulation of membrane protease activity